MKDKGLTPKQAAFVEEYLVDLNATQAAIRAGYSAKTAYSIGNENLSKPQIAEAIQARKAERSAATEITAERVLKALGQIAFTDQTGLFSIVDGKVEIKDTVDLSEDERMIISEISVVNGEIRVKTQDRQRALDMIARHLGMFPSRVELSGPNGGPVKVEHMSDEMLERIAAGGEA